MNRKDDPGAAADSRPGSGPLRRWSQRKAQSRAAQQEPPATPAPEPPAAAPVLTDADMPPIESLDSDSDYSLFFSPGVSESLRQRALQKLFHSGLYNDRCPLDGEYYDCRGYEPLGSVITHEMREELEREAAKLKDRAQAALAADTGPGNGAPAIEARPTAGDTVAAAPAPLLAADPAVPARKRAKPAHSKSVRGGPARRPRGE